MDGRDMEFSHSLYSERSGAVLTSQLVYCFRLLTRIFLSKYLQQKLMERNGVIDLREIWSEKDQSDLRTGLI